MSFIWILSGVILLFFVKLDFKNYTIFPIRYLSKCKLPPVLMTGQTPIYIQYDRNDLFSIGKSIKDKLNPHILKVVKQLGISRYRYRGTRADHAQARETF